MFHYVSPFISIAVILTELQRYRIIKILNFADGRALL